MLVGNTPIIKLKTINNINLWAKCEFTNLTASIKDRVAKYIIEKAYENGELSKGQLIVEASSGNMGTSLAAIAQKYGNPVHIVCPAKTGIIKRKMIEMYGAKLTIGQNTCDVNDKDFYVNLAKDIATKENAYLVNQYDSLLNKECHYHTTGSEIVYFFKIQDINLDYFITVGGSGGTVSGCAKKIKENFDAKVIMPDPIGSVYYDLFYNKKIIPENIKNYKVEGPGNPKMCKSMDFNYIDEIVQFIDEDAFKGCDILAKKHGVSAGHSSGANFHIANQLIDKINTNNKDINILIILADSGMKYL
jgi:cystathionine beta-synthase